MLSYLNNSNGNDNNSIYSNFSNKMFHKSLDKTYFTKKKALPSVFGSIDSQNFKEYEYNFEKWTICIICLPLLK